HDLDRRHLDEPEQVALAVPAAADQADAIRLGLGRAGHVIAGQQRGRQAGAGLECVTTVHVHPPEEVIKGEEQADGDQSAVAERRRRRSRRCGYPDNSCPGAGVNQEIRDFWRSAAWAVFGEYAYLSLGNSMDCACRNTFSGSQCFLTCWSRR